MQVWSMVTMVTHNQLYGYRNELNKCQPSLLLALGTEAFVRREEGRERERGWKREGTGGRGI